MATAVSEIPPIVNATSTNTSYLSETSFAMDTTTLLNNLTATVLTNLTSGNDSFISDGSGNATGILQQPMLPEDDEGVHKNPELKYFSTVIIIFMGLTILIVPVFCFVGVLCARANIFKTVRAAAGRGWGFGDLNVPYAEFGAAEDYTKSDIAVPAPSSSSSSSNTNNCDVNILVAEDNRVPSSKNVRRGSFLRVLNEEDEDISSLPPTFVRNPA